MADGVDTPGESRKSSRLWIILGVVFLALVIGGGIGLFYAVRSVAGKVEAQKERRARLADLEAKRRDLTEAAKASAEEGDRRRDG
jgi:flagellar basal body-associated protein FliL